MAMPLPGQNIQMPQGPRGGVDPAALLADMGQRRQPAAIPTIPDPGTGFASITAQSLGQAGQILHSAAEGRAGRDLAAKEGEKNRQVDRERTAAIEKDAQLQREFAAEEARKEREDRNNMMRLREQFEIAKYGYEAVQERSRQNSELLIQTAQMEAAGQLPEGTWAQVYEETKKNARYGNVTLGDLLSEEGRSKITTEMARTPAMGGAEPLSIMAAALVKQGINTKTMDRAGANMSRAWMDIDRRIDVEEAPRIELAKSMGAITAEIEEKSPDGQVTTDEVVTGYKGQEEAVNLFYDEMIKGTAHEDTLTSVLVRAAAPGFDLPAKLARTLLDNPDLPYKIDANTAYVMRTYFETMADTFKDKAESIPPTETDDKVVSARTALRLASSEAHKVATLLGRQEVTFHQGRNIKEVLRKAYLAKRSMSPKEYEAYTQQVADQSISDFAKSIGTSPDELRMSPDFGMTVADIAAQTGISGAVQALGGDLRNYLLPVIAPGVISRVESAAQARMMAVQASKQQAPGQISAFAAGVAGGRGAQQQVGQAIDSAGRNVARGAGTMAGFLGAPGSGRPVDQETQDVDVVMP